MDMDLIFFTLLPILCGVAVIGLIGWIAVQYIRAKRRWQQQAETPPQTCPAQVAAKQAVQGSRTVLSAVSPTSFDREQVTDHTVTFRLESGEERTFSVEEPVFRLVAVGDQGVLSFQGDRFLGFDRT